MALDFQQFSEIDEWLVIQDDSNIALKNVLTLMARDNNQEFGWLNVVVLPTKDHKSLNMKYLGHDYATDVLTFPFEEDDGICGEVYLDAAVVQSNADRFDTSLKEEYQRMVIHGGLHLLGYNDATEDERRTMKEKEDYYLAMG